MALKIEDKVYRNLQEQVSKNKQDIEDFKQGHQVLSEFGIRVVGKVNTEEALPDPQTYQGNYGDAYSVGLQTPYDYYVYTRATNENPHPHWFNLGKFPLPGPQGEQGIQGEQGQRGSTISTGNTYPENPQVNDLYLNESSNNLFKYNGLGWDLVTNLKGEKGDSIIGPQGPVGPAGSPINMYGVVANTSLLPTPSTMDKSTAYLVGTQSPYTLYVIVGEPNDTSTWRWQSLGIGGSQVTVNGEVQGTFEANTKLDKVTSTDNDYRVYAIRPNGAQVTQRFGGGVSEYIIVNRVNDGHILVPVTPTDANHAASKSFVETACGYRVAQVNNESGLDKAYIRDASNTETTMTIDKSATANTIVKRGSGGNVYTTAPTDGAHAANKAYVDNVIYTTGQALFPTSGQHYSTSSINNVIIREYMQQCSTGYLINLYIQFSANGSVGSGTTIINLANAVAQLGFKMPDTLTVILMDNVSASARNATVRVEGNTIKANSTLTASNYYQINYTFIKSL